MYFFLMEICLVGCYLVIALAEQGEGWQEGMESRCGSKTGGSQL